MSLLGFDTSSFMPHGHCVLWREEILWPMVGSDAIIFLSYSAIPFGLFYFYKNRTDLSTKVKKILILFVLFIQLCGLSHLIGAYNYWNADYYTELLVKLATAVISMVTAIIVLKNIKALVSLPSPEEFRLTNLRLNELNENLEREVKKQTEKIQEERNFLKAIMEGMNDGIAEITPIRGPSGEISDFSFRPINDQILYHTGMSKEELTMPSMNEAVPEFMKNGRFKDYKRILLSEKTEVYDPSPFDANGRIFRAVYTKNKENDSLLLFIANVTEREELKMTNIQNSRLSALGELAGGIAHEINNPLQIIDGAARMVSRQIESATPEVKESLEMIRETVKRVSKIIGNLKRLSRNELNTLQKVQLKSFLDDIKDFVAQKIKNNGIVFLDTYNESKVETLIFNQVALSQILINLIHNSIDELVETVKESPNHTPQIDLSIKEEDNRVIIEVSDNGRGIPESKRDLIFNPLYTSKEVGHGTGLGLSLSKNLATQMNAEIRLKIDNRTRFQVVFYLGEHA